MDIQEAKALLDTEISRVKDIASGGDPFAATAANMRLRLLDLISHLFEASFPPVGIDADALFQKYQETAKAGDDALEARVAKLEQQIEVLNSAITALNKV